MSEEVTNPTPEENANHHVYGFMLGMLAGVLIGLLYAPMEGEKARRELNKKKATISRKIQSVIDAGDDDDLEGEDEFDDEKDGDEEEPAFKVSPSSDNEQKFEKEIMDLPDNLMDEEEEESDPKPKPPKVNPQPGLNRIPRRKTFRGI